jgi:hypothetical protein
VSTIIEMTAKRGSAASLDGVCFYREGGNMLFD